MTFRHVTGLDHAVILVRDLDRAQETYERMGFTLTPRGFHSLGSQNHCIMFGSDYLELMALPPQPPAAFQYFADFLAKGEGVGALALASDDAQGAHAEFVKAAIAAEAPLALSRPVAKLGEARFTLVQLPPAATPGFRSFVCQHHTRDIVWRPEYQQHALGATNVASIVVATGDPAGYAAFLGNLPMAFTRTDVSKTKRGEAAIGALRIRVRDKLKAAAVLKHGGFSFVTLKDGALVVAADAAHGVMLVFE
jgi:catechol 2,3-dioxygenase-like lactoylglutathione lyase family enzyme